MSTEKNARVYLVGAGPGSLELLTLKAHRLITSADVILYDSLVNEEILKLAPAKTKLMHVGKRRGQPSLAQDEINRLIVENSRQYDKVIRLKGGDPLIFGRGGEELNYLREQQIDIEVVPGITAAVAASASLQVPLTHRDYGQSVMFLSGYSKERGLPDYDWPALATGSVTLVFYMGLYHLKQIARKLLDCGKSPETPVVITSNCSLPNEQTHHMTLAGVEELADPRQIDFPAITVIGRVLEQKKPDLASEGQADEKSQQHLVILFHGARSLQNSSLPRDFTTRLSHDLGFSAIEYAFLTEQFTPNYKQVLGKIIENNSTGEIIIWPFFLMPGKHLSEDIPRIVSEYRSEYSQFKFTLWSAPGISEELYEPLLAMARGSLQH